MDATTDDLKKVQTVLNQIHQQFISVVKHGRAEKLAKHQDLFSGDYWTGEEAVTLGLVDGLSTYHEILEVEFGSQHALDYSQKPGLFGQLPRVAESLSSSITSAIWSQLSQHSGPRL